MPSIRITGRRTRENLATYLGCDVLDAARDRIRHILNICDTPVVAFSGGKDSLAVLHLTRQVLAEQGIHEVNVLFRDEELIPDSVTNFVDSYRQLPWIKMRWFAVPLRSSKHILGRTFDYVQWDPNRPHVREKPAWALTDEKGRVFDQYTMDEYVSAFYRGKICVLTGIRASESLTRHFAIMSKINDTTVAATSCKRVMMGRPIYDWNELDVFKFFLDEGIRYCPIYDDQVFNEEPLRVSTPLHAESARRLYNLRTRDPAFYDRILQVFPDVAVQERYSKEHMGVTGLSQYGGSYEGVKRYIEDKITDAKQRALALDRYRSVMVRAAKTPRSYPPAYLLKTFSTGVYKRQIQPLRHHD